MKCSENFEKFFFVFTFVSWVAGEYLRDGSVLLCFTVTVRLTESKRLSRRNLLSQLLKQLTLTWWPSMDSFYWKNLQERAALTSKLKKFRWSHLLFSRGRIQLFWFVSGVTPNLHWQIPFLHSTASGSFATKHSAVLLHRSLSSESKHSSYESLARLPSGTINLSCPDISHFCSEAIRHKCSDCRCTMPCRQATAYIVHFLRTCRCKFSLKLKNFQLLGSFSKLSL